jgi:hypothetical protein
MFITYLFDFNCFPFMLSAPGGVVFVGRFRGGRPRPHALNRLKTARYAGRKDNIFDWR